MQRTESELSERYFARIKGVQDRWFASCRGWLRTRSGRRILRNLDWTAYRTESAATWVAACKALGHWPRRESISPMEWRRDPR